ncbi:unnamed protein product [Closterium sp. NIES-65]|nr:unnamed protein product [Closterium sp. NIES-65]
MDIWGPARISGQDHERYFLLVVDDYSRYTTVFSLRTNGEVPDVLILWIYAACLQPRERFGMEFPVLRLHFDRSGEFSSNLLQSFCRGEGIRQTFTLPASLQQNGVAERRIGLSAAHQLNLWPRVSLPETSPTLRWTGEVGDASVFQFYHPTSRRVFPSQDVTFDESVPFYRFFPYRTAPLPPPPLFLAPGAPQVAPLPAPGPAPSGVSQVDPPPLTALVEVTGDSGSAGGAEPGGGPAWGAACGGAELGGAEPGGPGGAESGGAAHGGAAASGEQSPWSGRLRSRSAGASPLHSRCRLPLSPQQLREWYVSRQSRAAGARGPAEGGAGAGDSATGVVSAGGSRAAAGAGAGGFGAVGGAGAGGAGVGGSGGAAGAGAGGFGAAGGAGAGGAGAGGSGPAAGAGAGGATPEGSESAVARSPWSSRLRPHVPLTVQQLHDWYGRRQGCAYAARGSAAGGTSADFTGAGGGAGLGGARTGGTGAAGAGGAAAGDTEVGDPGTGGAGSGGAAASGVGPRGAGAEGSGAAGGTGAAATGGTVQPPLFFTPPSPSSQPPPDSVLHQVLSLPSSTGLPLQPGSPLPTTSPYSEQTGGLTERREPASRPVSPVRCGSSGRRVPRLRQPTVPGTHLVVYRPSSPPQRVPLPSPPVSSLPDVLEPESDRARAAHPTVTRLLATVVTDPSFKSPAASALVAELVDFAVACRLDYAATLVAESESVCPPSVGGECALGTDVLEDRQEDFECLAAAAPHLVAMLLAPERDPDAPDIPTPRSYAEAIAGEYSSQWQTAMDAEMVSWKSTGMYVDEVPPPRANIVDGMWIFRVKRPPGSPPVFKARYVARGFSQREGVDFFQTFSPNSKMTTLRVLLHVAAQRDYELHALDFSTPFLEGSLHEEIWLRRPPGFTGLFPPGT